MDAPLDLLSPQPARCSVDDDSLSGLSARKAETAQEDLQDLREKLGSAEACILELQQRMTEMGAARAAAEAAVQEHLVMREKQTERIRKAKAAGAKGLQIVTAERETAILRADKAELKTRRLQQQVVMLQKKLDDYTSVRPWSPAESVSSHMHAESAPTRALESPPSLPPMSFQYGNSALGTQIHELTRQLTQQLEAATMLASASDASLKSAHAKLASEQDKSESAKAALRAELAMLSQQAEADKAALTQQVQELTAQHEAQVQRDDTFDS
ncbi:hypothetical protein ABBQ38_005889 [Trebouxia sp. C0009 RCD-2024]